MGTEVKDNKIPNCQFSLKLLWNGTKIDVYISELQSIRRHLSLLPAYEHN